MTASFRCFRLVRNARQARPCTPRARIARTRERKGDHPMKFGKPLIAAAALAAALLLPATPAAAEPVTYNLSDGSVVISQDGEYVITQDDPSTPVTNTITVNAGVNATVTLSGVNIEFSEDAWGHCAFKIEDDSTGDVTVVLAEGTENRLVSGPNAAGLQKNGDGENVGTLTITGNGSLYASTKNHSSFSAGIGSSINNSTKNIVIESGNIEAYGWGGAGIGAGGAYTQGSMTSATNIRINGGTVITSVRNGANGIGGGARNQGEIGAISIFIAGGTITDNSAYGIGSSYPANQSIVITGGSVKSAAGLTTQPTDGEGNAVYPLTVPNPSDQAVTVNGIAHQPVNHRNADPTDSNLYLYVTGIDHTVKLGCRCTPYSFANGSFTAGEPYDEHTAGDTLEFDENCHWSVCTVCGITFGTSEHTLSTQSDETSHWQTCETCGYATDPEPHSFEWVVDREATATEAGSKHEECAACGYAKEAVEIPATGNADDSAGDAQLPSGPEDGKGSALPNTSDTPALVAGAVLAAGSALVVGGAAFSRKMQ